MIVDEYQIADVSTNLVGHIRGVIPDFCLICIHSLTANIYLLIRMNKEKVKKMTFSFLLVQRNKEKVKDHVFPFYLLVKKEKGKSFGYYFFLFE